MAAKKCALKLAGRKKVCVKVGGKQPASQTEQIRLVVKVGGQQKSLCESWPASKKYALKLAGGNPLRKLSRSAWR